MRVLSSAFNALMPPRVRHALVETVYALDLPTRRAMNTIRRVQELRASDLHAFQMERLRKLLTHAIERSPFYRDRFTKSGVLRPDGTLDLNRYSEVPPLSKADLRENVQTLDCRVEGARWNSSGGSTGEPTRLLQCGSHRAYARAIKLVFDEWSGYRPGAPKAILWGAERDIKAQANFSLRRVLGWLRNEHILNAFEMSSETQAQYIEHIRKLAPRQLLAYAEAAYELARTAERLGRSVALPKGSAVMTSASPLTPSMRRVIESQFCAPVFNRYGCREAGDIAAECARHTGLHVAASNVIVEVIRADGSPAGPGEYGELLITSLVNFAMPLVRYRIGDMGALAPSPCGCGCEWPLLTKVDGRTSDFVYSRAKEAFRVPSHVFASREWIVRYQVTQRLFGILEVAIVPAAEASPETLRALQAELEAALNHKFDVELECVREIKSSPSGKYRTVRNELECRR